MMYSVVIPVYRNEEFVSRMMAEFEKIAGCIWARRGISVEFVFVVDASPDNSYAVLRDALPNAPFQSQLLLHSRNFGSFAAIRTGLAAARGDYFGIIAADLQEPPDLLVQFLDTMIDGGSDVVVGVRKERSDPAASRIASTIFWSVYRRWVIKGIPRSGVDVFGCSRRFRDELLKLEESNSSLVGLIYWLGFKRGEVAYSRRRREFGKSAWTFRKRLSYLFDSIFSFTDLPIRALTFVGAIGTFMAMVIGFLVFVLHLAGKIIVPGYAPIMLAIVFFGALNLFGIGLVGSYAWRTYENTKRRPLSVVCNRHFFDGSQALPEEVNSFVEAKR